MRPIRGKRFFCSWSGGKDSCLALYLAVRDGAVPAALLTMLAKDGRHSRSHGLPVSLLEEQALSMNIPLVTRKTSWDDYEHNFTEAVTELRKKGIEDGVFGDIDLEDHLNWVERVCSGAGVQAHEPLWKRPRLELLEEFLDSGFTATIVAVKDGVLDRDLLGRTLDRDLVDEMVKAGIDASGEEGEYHTVVTGGPVFSSGIAVKKRGQSLRNGYWFLRLSPGPGQK